MHLKLELNDTVFTHEDTVKPSIINISCDTVFLYYPQYSSQSLELKLQDSTGWKSLNTCQNSGGLARFELEFWTSYKLNCYLDENPGPYRVLKEYSYIIISDHFLIK